MKVAMVFPGFGSQFVGMGKELYDKHRIIQEYFEQASSCLDINFVKLCFASSDMELSSIRNGYTALFLVSTSIAALLKQEGVHPQIVAGYNQGDYAALCAAEGIGLADGLYLLNKYALFYQQLLDEHPYAAIKIEGLAAHEVEDLCFKVGNHNNGNVFVAVYTTKNSQIIAGTAEVVERARELVKKLYSRLKCKITDVNQAVGLHSPLMNPVVEHFEIYLEKVDFHDLAVPMIESTRGVVIKNGTQVRDYIIARIHAPVVWVKVMEQLVQYDTIIEIGPGSMLTEILHEQYPDTKLFTINKQADLDILKKSLVG